MFFLIRCVFWLWVVFSTIFAQTSADGTARHRMPAASAALQAQTWFETAATQAARHCSAAPADCVEIAAQLSKLAARPVPAEARDLRSSGDQMLAESLPAAPGRFVTVPLPPRRPNFADQKKTNLEKTKLEKTARREYLKGRAGAAAAF